MPHYENATDSTGKQLKQAELMISALDTTLHPLQNDENTHESPEPIQESIDRALTFLSMLDDRFWKMFRELIHISEQNQFELGDENVDWDTPEGEIRKHLLRITHYYDNYYTHSSPKLWHVVIEAELIFVRIQIELRYAKLIAHDRSSSGGTFLA